MKPEITITKGAPADADALAHIKQAIWLDTYQNEALGIGADDILAKDFLCAQRIAKRAEHMAGDDGINHTLVARSGDQIIGYGRAVKGDEFDEIVTLYVLPQWQGVGAGSALLRPLLQWLGQREVRLGVVPYNTKAIGFYKKFGFQLGKEMSHDEPTFPTGKDLPELEMVRPQGYAN